jgi:hypothetical protein
LCRIDGDGTVFPACPSRLESSANRRISGDANRMGARRGFHLLLVIEKDDAFEPILP